MTRCKELGRLLRGLEGAERAALAVRISDEARRKRGDRVRDLQRSIREHRELHATCDYKPAVQ